MGKQRIHNLEEVRTSDLSLIYRCIFVALSLVWARLLCLPQFLCCQHPHASCLIGPMLSPILPRLPSCPLAPGPAHLPLSHFPWLLCQGSSYYLAHSYFSWEDLLCGPCGHTAQGAPWYDLGSLSLPSPTWLSQTGVVGWHTK